MKSKSLTIIAATLVACSISASAAPRALDGLIYEGNAPFCHDRFRSLDSGTNFLDLLPLFRYLTNYYSRPVDRPLRDWAVITATVSDVSAKGLGLILKVDTRESSGGVGANIHLTRHPLETKLVDGDLLTFIAHENGRYQYRNPYGALSTVQSYDYGQLPTPEQYTAIQKTIWADYQAKIAAAAAAKTNRLNKPAPLLNTNTLRVNK